QAELGELHALRALEQVPAELALARHMPEEKLPLHLEGVVVVLARHFLPARVEVERLRDVGVPDRARRVLPGLRTAAAQAGDRGAVGAIDVQRQQVVAAYTGGPRAVEVRDHALLEPEGRVRGVVRGRLVLLA